ncbi:hypothetical protein KXX52_009086, partial [Aspergillus fumigatus]
GYAGHGRGDRGVDQQDRVRPHQGTHPALGRRWHHRVGRDAGGRERSADHRLQRPCERQGARDRRAEQGGVEILRRHLRPDRRDPRGHGRRAGPRGVRNGRRPRRNPRGLLGGQDRQGRRSAGHRGCHPQGAQGAYHPGGCHHLPGRDRLAAPLQGRRGRSAGGSGVR